MDIKELKTLLKNSTSVLVMEEGKPEFVVMDYQVYQRMTKEPVRGADPEVGTVQPVLQRAPRGESREADILERLNREIMALQEQIQQEEASSQGIDENI